MRAFSRIPSTGGGSAGQGYVAGQSNRTTLGTYFDANGVMRVAPPKALRPNYVYKNGVWIRDGWLREGQATNLFQMDTTGQGFDGRVTDMSHGGAEVTGFVADLCPDGFSRNVSLSATNNPSLVFTSRSSVPYSSSLPICVSFFLKMNQPDANKRTFTLEVWDAVRGKSCGQNMTEGGTLYTLWNSANSGGMWWNGVWGRYWFTWNAGNTAGSVWGGSQTEIVIHTANPSWPFTYSLWGFQVEQGVTTPSSLILNTDTAKSTRAAD